MNKKTVAIVLAVAVVGVLLVGSGNILNLLQRAQPPNVQITSQSHSTGTEGLDYTLWVDVSVYNGGGPGTVTVWVEATQGSNSWRKAQSAYLELKGSRDLTFTFKEVSFWAASASYNVWVEY
ncbi:MAG: hypothetical protein V1915_00575 [Candidatus Bathyarchaeota archaeon]